MQFRLCQQLDLLCDLTANLVYEYIYDI